MDELEGNKLEAALLEAANDVADESTLDTVGLEFARRSVLGVQTAAERLEARQNAP